VEQKLIKVKEIVKTKSSNVGAIAFDDDTKVAFVSFNNGTLYKYEGVEREDFESLRDSESVGSHLSKVFLKKGFEYEKLENVLIELKEVEKALEKKVEVKGE